MTLADFFNAPTEIPLRDGDGNVVAVYKVAAPTQIQQGMYQRWLEQRAYDAIERRTYQDPAQQDTDRRLLNQDIAAGLYEWGGPVSVASLGTPKGFAKLLTIICEDQGLTPEVAEKLVEQQMAGIAAALWPKGNLDPKALAAILRAAGLPSGRSSSSSSTRRFPGRSKKSRKRRTRS